MHTIIAISLLAASAAQVEPDRPTAMAPLEAELTDFLEENTGSWSIRSNETMQDALDRWCLQAGWTLVWNASTNQSIGVDFTFDGGTTFKEAVKELFQSHWKQHGSLRAVVYKNNVLEIRDA